MSAWRSNRPGLKSDPNLTPLLDVVLQLIVFFMMLVHFGTRIEGANRAIRLPIVPAALPGRELVFDRLPVSLDRAGRLTVDEKRVEVPQQETWWAEEALRRRKAADLLGEPLTRELPTLILLRADREAPFGLVRRVLKQAQKQGFGRFSLVVERSPQP